MKFIISICSLILILSSTCFAKSKKVKRVEGRYEMSRHITPAQAEKGALEDAKQNALRKAGVPENVWSVFGTITENDGQKFQEVYSEMSLMATQGLINVISEKYGRIIDPEDNKEYATATIDAEVKTGTKIDKTYVLDVNGMDGVYAEKESLVMDFTIYGTDSYLKIFWFDGDEGSILYPNELAKNRIFSKETKYLFPAKEDNFELEITKRDPKADTEIVNVMMVATKLDIPYPEDKVTFNSILKWIYDIPSDQRCAYYQTIMVK